MLLTLQMLSGGITPREHAGVRPERDVGRTDHSLRIRGPAILYRGAGLEVVWPQFLALVAIGTVFFIVALTRFRKTIGTMT
jgi:ABC-2 type transport system permease protein